MSILHCRFQPMKVNYAWLYALLYNSFKMMVVYALFYNGLEIMVVFAPLCYDLEKGSFISTVHC